MSGRRSAVGPASDHPAGPSAASIGAGHRGDIDGLRAVAVSVVIAYHAEIPGFRAGFIGVDVFFVVSGFLIMGLLLNELSGAGTVSLRQFWARRIRRLAPALTVMLVGTLVASAFVFSALRWRATAVEGGWSSVYVSNYAFARSTRGYFVESAIPSPFLHTWSLGVEEQFYLLWPLVVVVLAKLASKVRRQVGSLLVATVVLGGAGSFALSYFMSERRSPWAYYSLPTRWWEIGLGIGAAMFCHRHRLGRRWAPWSMVAGVILLVVGMVVITPTTVFPGLAALLPTLGTAAVLVGGAANGSIVSTALGVAPLQWLGRLSYSWYLWHWPAMVLLAAALRSDSEWVLVGAGVGSLGLAWLTHRLIERPVRFSPRLTTSVRACFALGVGCVAVVALVGGALVLVGQRELRDPYLRELKAAVDSRSAGVVTCDLGTSTTCQGEANGIMLIGDSHAAHWAAALETAADELGVPLTVRTRGGCPPWGFAVVATGSDEPSGQCRAFTEETDRLLDTMRPWVVVVAIASYDGEVFADGQHPLGVEREREVVTGSVRRTIEHLQSLGSAVGVVLDNPRVPFDPVECLGVERSGDACRFLRSDGLSAVEDIRDAQQEAIDAAEGVAVFDAAVGMCTARWCDTQLPDGTLVYADQSHLTDTYTASQVPELERFLGSLVDRPR